MAGCAERGKVDGTGASARFDQPVHLTQDERGRLLVLDNVTQGSVRVVEASLAPPQRLVPKVQPVVQDPLRMDYSKLLMDTALADVTFVVDGQRFQVHRCVLAARSPYFRAMFESG